MNLKPSIVPDLAAVAADPAVASQLPADQVEALLGKCSVAQGALVNRLLALRASGNGQPSTEGDRRLNVGEAAAKLDMSEPWLYRNANKLLFTIRIGRSLGFSSLGIEKYLKRRTGR